MLNKESFAQLIRFGLVGVLNTAVDFCVYQFLVWLGLHYAASQCISYSCGLLNSYFFNRRWTFRQEKTYTKKEFIRFLAVNLGSLALSVLLLRLCYEVLGIQSNLLAKGIVTAFVMVINFLGNKLFVFK
ncbi:MAG: GtrA family protein [Clostridia bacterium]|nr:GtrA family protein [Candidatus Pelethousia sp.]NCB31367.1 GtrA family protein [Clostridia bacterium]